MASVDDVLWLDRDDLSLTVPEWATQVQMRRAPEEEFDVVLFGIKRRALPIFWVNLIIRRVVAWWRK